MRTKHLKNKMKTKNALVFCMVLLSLSLVSAITIKDVSSTPNEIAPGETASISIELENIFEEDVYNLEVGLDFSEVPFAPYESSSEKYLDKLNDGDDEDFEFEIIALPSASSGIYKVPITISYDDGNGNSSTKTDVVSFTINSKPELKVSLEDSVVLIKGRENTFSIKIINSGLADIKFLYVSLGANQGLTVLSENQQYLGDVDSDDFDSVEYNLFIDSNTKNAIIIPVYLTYKDSTNKEFYETKTVSLRTYSLKEAQELGLVEKPNYIVWIVIALIIGLFFLNKFLKKRKRRKLKEKK